MSEKDEDLNADAAPFLEIFVIETTFPLGMLVSTPGALTALEEAGESPATYLSRHARRDWGQLDTEDVLANNRALEIGGRLLSAYTMSNGTRLWIITESDKSATTLLLPSEY